MKSARLKAIVGTNVKTLREQRGWSQEQLAVTVDRTWQSISHIETGKSLPPLPTLAALATTFGVPIARLLEEDLPLEAGRADLLQRAQVTLSDLTDPQLETAVGILTTLHRGFQKA
ncbi:MAG TPA: helix-turn-helix transcriptional regulator [Magnetospirillum sp.]|jgi:DNA-binding XRE family transcriptional regulator|nr:helix-turn-helix transcriptional regulator [Magnetospirillum sp.]